VKNLPVINDLAYFVRVSVTNEESFQCFRQMGSQPRMTWVDYLSTVGGLLGANARKLF
jgi:hypothetical protein